MIWLWRDGSNKAVGLRTRNTFDAMARRAQVQVLLNEILSKVECYQGRDAIHPKEVPVNESY